MERQLSIALLVLSLAVSPAAVGADRPTVPQDALHAVPDALQADWRSQDERIARLSRELELVRGARELSESLDAVDVVRRDLRAALTVATQLEEEARSELQAAQLARVDARVRLDLAKLDERLAWDDVRDARGRHEARAARSRRNDARDRRREARDRLRAATEAWVRAEEATRATLRVSEQAMALARSALDELPPFSPSPSRRISERELALLQARRDLAIAEREHDRAVAVAQSGGRVDLDRFVAALDDARAAEESARRALSR